MQGFNQSFIWGYQWLKKGLTSVLPMFNKGVQIVYQGNNKGLIRGKQLSFVMLTKQVKLILHTGDTDYLDMCG